MKGPNMDYDGGIEVVGNLERKLNDLLNRFGAEARDIYDASLEEAGLEPYSQNAPKRICGDARRAQYASMRERFAGAVSETCDAARQAQISILSAPVKEDARWALLLMSMRRSVCPEDIEGLRSRYGASLSASAHIADIAKAHSLHYEDDRLSDYGRIGSIEAEAMSNLPETYEKGFRPERV